MFKTQLLLSAARIDELGQYHSPNICFIAPDEDDTDGGQDDQDGGAQADEEDGEGDAPEGDEADGEEGDDGESDPDHEGEAEDAGQEGRSTRQAVDREAPRRRSTSDVIRDNKRAAKEASAKADEAIRRAEAAERRAEAAERAATERRQSETQEQERLRLDSMTTEERYDYNLRKQDEAHRNELNGVKFQIWDSADQRKFDRLVDRDPLIARVQDKVEAEIRRRQAAREPPVEREIIANQEIAKMMRARRVPAGERQRSRGAERVQRETARPVRARGNEAPPARARRGNEDTPAARRARLADVQI